MRRAKSANVDMSLVPTKRYGKLSLDDVDLVDEKGNPVQLRGVSTHGLQWFPLGDSLTPQAIEVVAKEWKADVFRVAMYVDEGGYKTDPAGFTEMLDAIVEQTLSLGMYSIIDWHILSPGDPMMNLEDAKVFFEHVSKKHGPSERVIYEICNEPNGSRVTWARIKEYAKIIIPIIRANDPDGIIIVGTPAWSSLGISGGPPGDDIKRNPLKGALGHNVMYAFHFYAASHIRYHKSQFRNFAGKIPIFASEWGSQEYTGDGPNNIESTEAWLDLFDKHNVSWVNWNYSDDHRSGAVWKKGTFPAGPFDDSNLKEAGLKVKEWISRDR